ncbi:MAG: hypothetical protein HYV78_02435 [Candidatus Wildermuthbacteria bacterium]|nr:hypothetical protein [Candidatus Wildermuthbacteria bacterium]
MIHKIIPAILTNDLADMKGKLDILRGVSEWAQIDVADGVFVGNKTLFPSEFAGATYGFQLEIHLMARNPESYFDACAAMNACRVIFHLEAAPDLQKTLALLSQYEFKKGIAINPETPADSLLPHLASVDSVLLLTVQPGFQGREFISSVLEKVWTIKQAKTGIIVGVDGGIGFEHIQGVFGAGADYAVIGSAIWQSENPAQAFRKMSAMVE